jgi:Tol biopolymer transport system component
MVLMACRDGVEPYATDPVEPIPNPPTLVRLTYSPGIEQDPIWSKNSDTVFYSATNFFDTPNLPGALLSLSRNGGVAHVLLPEIQRRSSRWHVLPVPSPTGDRIAYVELATQTIPATCIVPLPPPLGPADCPIDEPLLDSAVLRVRDTADGGVTLRGDAPFRFPGSDPARALGGSGVIRERYFPFQQIYGTQRSLLFRPAWSPNGQQLVFSDGLNLYLWTVGPSAPVPIPNTRDGVSPAWSPDGSVIAFTRLVRGDSTTASCQCSTGGDTSTHTRTTYIIAARRLTLINPDGTGAVDVTSGEEPAFSPDGNTLYFRDDVDLYRIPRAGGTPEKLPNTEDGHSPAVSPDGRWLAFSRTPELPNPNGNIWILNLNKQ